MLILHNMGDDPLHSFKRLQGKYDIWIITNSTSTNCRFYSFLKIPLRPIYSTNRYLSVPQTVWSTRQKKKTLAILSSAKFNLRNFVPTYSSLLLTYTLKINKKWHILTRIEGCLSSMNCLNYCADPPCLAVTGDILFHYAASLILINPVYYCALRCITKDTFQKYVVDRMTWLDGPPDRSTPEAAMLLIYKVLLLKFPNYLTSLLPFKSNHRTWSSNSFTFDNDGRTGFRKYEPFNK